LTPADSSPETTDEELRRARARLADVERELALWKLRAGTAEGAAAQWQATQQRSLWRIFVALDRMRARLAPPQTRRDRAVRAISHGAAGALLAISPGRASTTERLDPTGRKAVLLVYDDQGAWTRYRCEHLSEQLGYLGATSDIVQSRQIDLAKAIEHYECVVLNRVSWTDAVSALFERARALGKIVIFDTDDLVFEPAMHAHFAFLDHWTDRERRAWTERLGEFRMTLRACGRASVSTAPLCEHARRHCDHVEVVFNAVSEQMVALADAALEQHGDNTAPFPGREVSIAYLSGSRTHERDFSEAGEALVWALDTYPQVRCLLVGKLDLDARFDRFESRIARIPVQPWQALPELLSRVDVNLAPLERDNPFTECKSSVKYLEAALVAVPTIASARPDFVRVIDHRRNGLLADSPEEWREALRQLIESPELRHELGRRAHDDVRLHHTTKRQARLVERRLAALTTDGSGRKRSLIVNWVVSDGGEPARMAHLVEFLLERGHRVRVCDDALDPADVSVATDALTAKIVARHRDSPFKCRLVSTVDEDATTYELPLRLIGLETPTAERLTELTGRPADAVDGSAAQLEEILLRTCFVPTTARVAGPEPVPSR
jgi:glycosyltransferase involved in cell wall biosynthesis